MANKKSEQDREQSEISESEGIAQDQSPEDETMDQDPGERQRQNQGDEKDDPLAA